MTVRRGLCRGTMVLVAGLGTLLACSGGGGGSDDGEDATGGTSAVQPGTGGAGGSDPLVTGGSGGGGAPATGGDVGSGATATTGGVMPTGGAPATGGVDMTGGLPATGGTAPTGGVATGGDATGGDATGGDATGGTEACESGPLETSLPDCAIDMPAATGDYHQDCVDVINAWRWQCQCLPPLERWPEGEACADEMAQYDYEVNVGATVIEPHAGFIASICSPSGSGQCECPAWGSIESITQPREGGFGGMRESCLEMMWHEVDNPAGEQGHYEAMSSTRYAQVACGIYQGPDGDVWAVQNYSR